MEEIDWTKPIETEWGDAAFVNKVFLSGDALVTYWNNDDQRHLVDVMGVNDHRVRNKPELIKPEGWVNIYPNDVGKIHQIKQNADLGRSNNCLCSLSMEDLMSGKFKDGIPKGYGLGGEDD